MDAVDTLQRDQTIIEQYFATGKRFTKPKPEKICLSSSLVSDDESESEEDYDYLSTIDIKNDTSWGKLVYSTDTDGKRSWQPDPLATELLQNRYGLELTRAIYNRDIKTINKLLRHDVNLEICDENGNNALILSVGYRFREFVRFLLYRGVELEDTNDEGANALHVACLNEDERLVYILLYNGCNPNTPVRNTGDTPLHIACSGTNSFGIVKMLTRKNVDLTAINNQGETPLKLAQENENEDVVKYLEKKIEKEKKRLMKIQKKISQNHQASFHEVTPIRRFYYNPETNSLVSYVPPELRTPPNHLSIQREEDTSFMFNNSYQSEKAEDSEVNSDPDLKFLLDNDFEDNDENIINAEEQEMFWGNNPWENENSPGYESPLEEDMIDLDNLRIENPLLYDEERKLANVPSKRINIQSKDLYFCKKCYTENLDVTTGVCGNCHQIYGMYSICPWCEPGHINGYGSCDNCEFILYKKPKLQGTDEIASATDPTYAIAPSISEMEIDNELHESHESPSQDNVNVCICCGHVNVKAQTAFVFETDNEYCSMCGYLLSDLCNSCGTVLRFEGEDEELQESCWQCEKKLLFDEL